MIRRPPRSTLFPSTPLFRSSCSSTRARSTSPRRSCATCAPPTPGSTAAPPPATRPARSEEHTSELQSQSNLECRLLLEKKNDVTNSLWILPSPPPLELVLEC